MWGPICAIGRGPPTGGRSIGINRAVPQALLPPRDAHRCRQTFKPVKKWCSGPCGRYGLGIFRAFHAISCMQVSQAVMVPPFFSCVVDQIVDPPPLAPRTCMFFVGPRWLHCLAVISWARLRPPALPKDTESGGRSPAATTIMDAGVTGSTAGDVEVSGGLRGGAD